MSRQRPTLANLLVGMAYLAYPHPPYHLLEYSLGASTLFALTDNTPLIDLNTIIHPDDLLEIDYQRQTHIKRQKAYDLEYRIIDQQQQIKYVHEQGQVIEDNGEIFISGFINDITSRTKTRQQKQLMQQTIVAAALDSQLALGNFDCYSEIICQMAAETLSTDVVGVWLLSEDQQQLRLVRQYNRIEARYYQDVVLYAKDYPRYFAALISGRAIDAGNAYLDPRTNEFSSVYLPQTGIYALLDAAIRVSGKVVGVLCCEHKQVRYWNDDDVSFVGQLGDQLAQALANQQHLQTQRLMLAAEARNTAKSQFFASISHEIRTPMNGILGMIELLQLTSINQKQQHYLSIIEESGQLLLRIINDLLDFAKLEAGKFSLYESSTHIENLFQQATTLLQHSVSPHTAIHIEINPQLPKFLLIDGSRLQQILLNLLSNAIKFTSKGAILIRANLIDEHYWFFEVIDTGEGMSPETLENLFQPFSQGKNAQRKQGTGLGLAICKHLVELMSGHIIVNSRLGSGTSFRVELPLYLSHEQQPTDQDHLPLHAEHLKVLIVEDNAINQMVLSGLLDFLNIKSDICANSQDAVQQFNDAHGQYDVIFMDCELPDRDGFMTTQIIRQSHFAQDSLKIIASTAHSFIEQQQQAKQSGMDYFLSKPVRLESLIQLLRLIIMQPSDSTV